MKLVYTEIIIKRLQESQHCPYCKEPFVKSRPWQKTCKSEVCQAKHRKQITRQWFKANPGYMKFYMVYYTLPKK